MQVRISARRLANEVHQLGKGPLVVHRLKRFLILLAIEKKERSNQM